jgi:murein DD-endopeptidase MepM/ murein hydrolase activator NlpD
MTSYAHTSGSTPRRIAWAALLLSAVALASTLGSPKALGGGGDQPSNAGSYGWPVKPFDKQHPIRGSFADPRTIFRSSPTLQGVLDGDCSCSLHQGVDISAPDGSPVYPVVSGTVTYVDSEWVKVESSGGQAFEYWHIRAIVSVGSHVEAHHTLIGRILRGSGHVHLTELKNGRAVNPLAPGHLGPYADHTTPRVTSISFRRTETGREGLPNLIRGRVLLVAAAEDEPTIDAPEAWRGLPVTPALLTWEIRSWNGRLVLRRKTAADFRGALPNRGFWQIYARGTYQNMAVLGHHYSWAQPGSYLFKLSPEGFDTHRLRDGAYDLVVTATDIRGNSSSLTRRFTVGNHRS